MSNWKSLYPGSATVRLSTVEPGAAGSIDSVSLRDDFNSLINGGPGETPIGQSFIFRRMRRDSDNNKTACICVDSMTKEPDIDYPCSHCGGVGWLWDEEIVVGYKMVVASANSNAQINLAKHKTGLISLPAIKFYLKYDEAPLMGDQIIEVQLDTEGSLIYPYQRLGTYELNLIRAMRGDYGRIEFWVCDAQRIGPVTEGYIV